MKYHKIHGVEKSICTCEQKIAYNLAFRAHINYGDEFKQLPTAAAKSSAVADIVHFYINAWKRDGGAAVDRYDIDSIFCALNAGLWGYLERPFIAASYEQIGAAFPAHYL